MTYRPSAYAATMSAASAGQEVRCVCLDVDDTLVDYERASRAALSATLGSDERWPLWQQLADRYAAMVIAGDVERESMPLLRARAFLSEIRAGLDDIAATDWESRRLAELNRSWELFDDALPCLDWLRAAGVTVAALTNASGRHQSQKLGMLGVAGFFDCLLIAGELGVAKPDPVMFRTLCARVGLPPAQVVHVGDRLDQDAIGARNAGLHGVWLNRRGRPGVAADGVPVIRSLAELPELLVGRLSIPLVHAAR